MQGLPGKVALVTGAGSGIGLATARRLHQEGCRVIGGIQTPAQRAALDGVDSVLFDVSREEGWSGVARHALDRYGGLDILVNVAGVSRVGSAEETGLDLWEETLAVNLTGTFLGCRAAIPLMRRRGGGAIVNSASINALRGNSRLVAYAASKGGVVALTMALAIDHAADNIRVNCVCPGSIDTGMLRGMAANLGDPGAVLAASIAKHPLGRLGQPEEVASAIAFLASDEGAFMTGLAVPVDGGRSIR
jgi:NAD(P)-dependent dehydrogenase (short-subunit alcohol dehydrogenase family)